jgi:hypothetical protein
VSKDKPQTTETDAGDDDAKDDVISDPSEGAQGRSDWSDEGGATPGGPAPST